MREMIADLVQAWMEQQGLAAGDEAPLAGAVSVKVGKGLGMPVKVGGGGDVGEGVWEGRFGKGRGGSGVRW